MTRHGHRHDRRSSWASCSSRSPGRRVDDPASTAAPGWGWRSPAASARLMGGDIAVESEPGRRLDVHHPAAGRGRRTGRRRRPTRPAAPRHPAARPGRNRPGDRRRPGRPRRGHAQSSSARGVPGRDRRQRRRRGWRWPAELQPAGDHPRRDHAGHGRLGGARRPQGRPGAGRHPGRHADDRGRAETGLRARGGRLPDQADRPRPACARSLRRISRGGADGRRAPGGRGRPDTRAGMAPRLLERRAGRWPRRRTAAGLARLADRGRR